MKKYILVFAALFVTVVYCTAQNVIILSKEDSLNEETARKTQISIANVEGSTYPPDNAIDIADLREHKIVVEEEPQDKPFVAVEQMPQFPGGEAEMMKFIKENLRYPTIAKENGIQGRVIVRFVVEKDGSLSDVVIIRSLDPVCDREAIRLMRISPKWVPGKQNGRAVRVYYTLPIIFKIEEEEENLPAQEVTIAVSSIDPNENDGIGIQAVDVPGVDIAEVREYKTVEKREEMPFTHVEQMPSFPGGESGLKKFIDANLRYPVVAQENDIQGRVILRFIVEKDGKLSNIEVLRSLDPVCDREAIRLMKTSPKWIPGKQNGRDVGVYYTLPVTFRMEEDGEQKKKGDM